MLGPLSSGLDRSLGYSDVAFNFPVIKKSPLGVCQACAVGGVSSARRFFTLRQALVAIDVTERSLDCRSTSHGFADVEVSVLCLF